MTSSPISLLISVSHCHMDMKHVYIGRIKSFGCLKPPRTHAFVHSLLSFEEADFSLAIKEKFCESLWDWKNKVFWSPTTSA
mmetsp:Transcript_39827/g.67927  ORF Transcript_39827/g.67927 Transcript_39827/m.67927 type:complete len:81 (-) Transcript_39827:56-298(-)